MRDALMLELHGTVDTLDPSGTGRKLKIKRLRLVAIAMVNAAIKGDVTAQREIFDRADGKVPTEVRGGGQNGAFLFENVNPEDMTDEQLDAVAAALARRFEGPRGGKS